MTAGLPADDDGANAMAATASQPAEEQQGSMTVQEETELKHRSVKVSGSRAVHRHGMRVRVSVTTLC